MQVEELIWREHIIEKLQRKHQVTQAEVEEVFFAGRPYFRSSSNVVYAFGQTQAGRYLFVVFKYVGQERAAIITARAMDHAERRYYKKRRGLP